jgi:hypothetical protein
MTFDRRRFVKTTGLLAAADILGSSASSAAAAARPSDELWFINTRGVPYGNLSHHSLHCWSAWRAVPGGAWQQASIADLWGRAADGRRNVFYVHGNRINVDWAMRNGNSAYQALTSPVGFHTPPMRLVMWSWPSDRILRPALDVRVKADVADYESYKLGWFLGNMHPQGYVGLIGFSYGARMITGALHLLSGGSLFGQALGAHHLPPTRSVLWSAATHNYWLSPGQLHGRAILATDRMLNLYNSRDSALRRYPHLDKSTLPQALGYVGLPNGYLGAEGYRFAQRDVCCEVGRRHAMDEYCAAPNIVGQTKQYALWG